MKKLFVITGLAIAAMACSRNATPQKAILGAWVNPYTYESTGEFKGFRFLRGGKCEAINIPSLDLKTWEVRDNKLMINGFSIEEDGSREPYNTVEPIDLLTRDSLRVVANAKPKACFLYINLKNYKVKK